MKRCGCLNEGQIVEYDEVPNKGKTSAENRGGLNSTHFHGTHVPGGGAVHSIIGGHFVAIILSTYRSVRQHPG